MTGEPLVVHARFLVTCLGRMAFPQYPSIPGAETFTGPVLHTARWRQDVDLKVCSLLTCQMIDAACDGRAHD